MIMNLEYPCNLWKLSELLLTLHKLGFRPCPTFHPCAQAGFVSSLGCVHGWFCCSSPSRRTRPEEDRGAFFSFFLQRASSHDVHQQRHPAHKFLRNKRCPEVATEWRKTIARDPCFWRRFQICSCPEATSERRFLIFRPSISSREVWRGLSLPVTWTSTLMCCMTTTQL